MWNLLKPASNFKVWIHFIENRKGERKWDEFQWYHLRSCACDCRWIVDVQILWCSVEPILFDPGVDDGWVWKWNLLKLSACKKKLSQETYCVNNYLFYYSISFPRATVLTQAPAVNIIMDFKVQYYLYRYNRDIGIVQVLYLSNIWNSI